MLHSVSNPAELALPYAEQLVTQGYLDHFDASLAEEQKLVELEREADIFGMLGKQYFVRSHRSMAISVNITSDEDVAYYNFGEGLDFRGRLVTYSTTRIGRTLGAASVRALCLAFDEVTLLPYCDTLPDDNLLYTPAFAVKSIERFAA